MSEINARQTALILAGLRCLQQVADQSGGDLGDLHDILDEAPGPDDQCLGEEIDALCEALNGPESREVWLATDRQDCGITENETAVFRTREAAVAQARAWIEEYRNDSRVAGEIDAVLEQFDAHAARGDGLFGAGDDAASFWVEVCRYDVRG